MLHCVADVDTHVYVLQSVAVCFRVLPCVWQCVAVCCSVLQCVAVCGSVLQCVAVCCSVLQFVVDAALRYRYEQPSPCLAHTNESCHTHE